MTFLFYLQRSSTLHFLDKTLQEVFSINCSFMLTFMHILNEVLFLAIDSFFFCGWNARVSCRGRV